MTTITGNSFTGNSAASGYSCEELICTPVVGKGGAVLVRSNAPTDASEVILSNNSFDGNFIEPDAEHGNADQSGGAVCVRWAHKAVISANTFTSNTANDFGGGLSLESSTEATVVNNLFRANEAGGTGGGAACALDTSPSLVNNTFVGNSATSAEAGWGNGGGVLLWASPVGPAVSGLSINNIFCDNAARNYSSPTSVGNSLACLGLTSEAAILFCDSYSALYCNTDAYHYYLPNGLSLGAGNEHADPLFVDPASDFHLQLPGQGIWSPIDKGHDPGSAPYQNVPSSDLDGPTQTRPTPISTVPDGSGGTCDMGAYEKHQ